MALLLMLIRRWIAVRPNARPGVAIRVACGPDRPSAVVVSAAPPLRQSGRSSTLQHLRKVKVVSVDIAVIEWTLPPLIVWAEAAKFIHLTPCRMKCNKCERQLRAQTEVNDRVRDTGVLDEGR